MTHFANTLDSSFNPAPSTSTKRCVSFGSFLQFPEYRREFLINPDIISDKQLETDLQFFDFTAENNEGTSYKEFLFHAYDKVINSKSSSQKNKLFIKEVQLFIDTAKDYSAGNEVKNFNVNADFFPHIPAYKLSQAYFRVYPNSLSFVAPSFDNFSPEAMLKNVTRSLPMELTSANNTEFLFEILSEALSLKPKYKHNPLILANLLEEYLKRGYFSSENGQSLQHFKNKFLFLVNYISLPKLKNINFFHPDTSEGSSDTDQENIEIYARSSCRLS